MPATLYLVATPIGHLEDITYRAVRVLGEVAVVAAEDTRRTAGLLAHYGIRTPVVSLHAHNEHERAPELVARLLAGESVAVVSDAGTPLVSDPGGELVAKAHAAGIHVEALPGASALLAALVCSGLPAGTFTFLGFVPARAGERDAWLRLAAAEPRTVVCYEAPHRIRDTLGAMVHVFGDRPIALGRELTKVHEEVLTGTASDVLTQLVEDRGEFTLVIGPPHEPEPRQGLPDDARIWAAFRDLTDKEGFGRREAVTALARRYGMPAKEVYAAIERAKA